MYAPTPSLPFLFHFGSLLGFWLFLQLLSGFLLACHFCPLYALVFSFTHYSSRDGVSMWALRSLHSSAASLLFLFLFLHLFTRCALGLPARTPLLLWASGCLLLFLLSLIAFLGYVLPWGSLSFWALTVLTNLLTVLPFGLFFRSFVWGSPFLSSVSLLRFFGFHFLLPLLSSSFSLFHLLLLHLFGSSAPGSVSGFFSGFSFLFFYYADVLSFSSSFSLLLLFLAFSESLRHASSFFAVCPLSTPLHIVPEWYFLPWYSLLRSCSSKLLGVLLLVLGLLQFCFLPAALHSSFASTSSCSGLSSAGSLGVLLALGFVSLSVPVYPYVEASLVLAFVYFYLSFGV